nr:MAG TPA: hypothetical protein [Caudoviricetes sp.]
MLFVRTRLDIITHNPNNAHNPSENDSCYSYVL